MNKYDEMRNFYEERIKSMREDLKYYERHIDRLSEEIKKVRDDNVERIRECAEKAAKIEMYETIFDRLFGLHKDHTDKIFTFKGDHYQARSFTLDCDLEEADILTVEFVKVFDQKKGATNVNV